MTVDGSGDEKIQPCVANFFFFWTAWFELLGALVVDSRGAITFAALRDVNLRKRCVALPRYIVFVYILRC